MSIFSELDSEQDPKKNSLRAKSLEALSVALGADSVAIQTLALETAGRLIEESLLDLAANENLLKTPEGRKIIH